VPGQEILDRKAGQAEQKWQTGHPEWDRQNRTSRTGQAEQERKNVTDRIGQDKMNWTYITGKAEWDRQKRTGRIGGCLPLQIKTNMKVC
jgi:hypothetical protein